MRNWFVSVRWLANAWWPAIITKFRRFVSRNTPNTSSGNAAAASSTSAAWMIRPPTSGNVANVARLASRSEPGLRARTWSKSTLATPIAAAGAGPSSAMASTSARNEPEMRWPWWLTANRSLASASTRMTATRESGSHCSAVETSAARVAATARTIASTMKSDVRRVNIRS